MNRRSWHRRASKPILYWLIALVIAVAAHPIIPQFRWLLVHMVTLGLVTTSIMIWGQHFTEALLKTRLGEESRPTQVRRIWALTAAVAVTMVGMVADWPWVTVLGSVGVSAAMLWYAFALGAQIKAALAPRFAFVVRSYLTAALLLPVGALFGALLAFSPGEPWQGRLLLAHQLVNILGFVGITATATLLTLWPTVLRTTIDGRHARRASRSLVLMMIGLALALVGALVNNLLIGVGGIAVYLAGQLSIAALLAALARTAANKTRREPLPLFPVLSLGAAVAWFVGTTIALGVMWAASAGGADGAPVASPLNFSMLATDVQRLTVPFVVGFLLQLLFGAMSFLMPTAMGGGPRALRASLAEMSRFAVARVVIVNLAVALFAFASGDGPVSRALFSAVTLGTFTPEQFGSVTRVLVSTLAFVALAAFIVLMVRMVKVNVRERVEFQKRVALGMPTAGLPAASAQRSGAAGAGELASPDAPGAPGPGGERAAASASLPVQRRHLTSALVAMGSVFGIAAVGRSLDGTLASPGAAPAGAAPASGTSAPAVTPTGNTTRLKVEMTADMRFVPDVLEVPAGDVLEIELHNVDPVNAHDLVLETGQMSGRVQPGESTVVDAGVIGGSVEGWCSIVGHRAMGMVLTITALGVDAAAPATSATAASGADPLARVSGDLAAAPGASHVRRDPVLPPAPTGTQAVTFDVQEAALELAPGIAMEAMTYNGQIMGPILRSTVGGRIDLTLTNSGTMGHSIDFHAGTVSPTAYMRTIAPGQSLTYPLVTDHAGMWLYHCSTAPMTVHLSAGMYGAVIVPPADAPSVDREYVLVQSEHYLEPGASEASGGPDGTALHAISPDKIHAERPDFTVFNGHATQYVAEPLEARVGERVRIWVLAAGPSRGLSFHVVGTVFDTVFKEGEYSLRPDNATGGAAQALDLASCQGGFVDMTFREPGVYKAVNHQFVDLERGALALITVTA